MALKLIISRLENKATYPSGNIGSSKSLSAAFDRHRVRRTMPVRSLYKDLCKNDERLCSFIRDEPNTPRLLGRIGALIPKNFHRLINNSGQSALMALMAERFSQITPTCSDVLNTR
jgi:hypothetical protein